MVRTVKEKLENLVDFKELADRIDLNRVKESVDLSRLKDLRDRLDLREAVARPDLDKLAEALRERREKKTTNTVIFVLALIGAAALAAGIAILIYRYFTPAYTDDFDDDFEDFEDDGDDAE